MRLLRLLLAAAAAGVITGGSHPRLAGAETLPSADQPVERVIDHFIDAGIAAAGVQPAPQADDATIVRRLTLDLVGRVPTAGEVDAYVTSAEPDKRARLIDRLMSSPGFARHQAAMFEAMLNPEGDRRGGTALREYLTVALTRS